MYICMIYFYETYLIFQFCHPNPISLICRLLFSLLFLPMEIIFFILLSNFLRSLESLLVGLFGVTIILFELFEIFVFELIFLFIFWCISLVFEHVVIDFFLLNLKSAYDIFFQLFYMIPVSAIVQPHRYPICLMFQIKDHAGNDSLLKLLSNHCQ